MAVATTAELAHYLGGWNYTGVQEIDAQMILDGTQSDLERHLNRPLQMRRVQEYVDTDFRGYAYLRVTPIQALHGVYTVTPDGERGELITNLSDRAFKRGRNYLWLGPRGRVLVDYTGGVNADLDPGVKLAIMRVAGREFMYQHGEAMVVENGDARRPPDPATQARGWTEEELAKFDRLRRRVVR